MNKTKQFQISGGLVLLLYRFDCARFRRNALITTFSTGVRRNRANSGSFANQTANGGEANPKQDEPRKVIMKPSMGSIHTQDNRIQVSVPISPYKFNSFVVPVRNLPRRRLSTSRRSFLIRHIRCPFGAIDQVNGSSFGLAGPRESFAVRRVSRIRTKQKQSTAAEKI